ncbi:MAG: T9SS type A sorting domain-containing protein [Bacteroidales bacterium]|nr:T9SS type A sorting domain-containing protein [Bacteroidales bacterium]
MKSVILSVLFFVLCVQVSLAGSGPTDVLTFGNAASEQTHQLVSEYSDTYQGSGGQTARRFLPNPDNFGGIYGGEASFVMQIDSSGQNYVTVKLSGDEYRSDAAQGRIILAIGDRLTEVGNRSGGNESVFVDHISAPMSKGAFVYRTVPLPIHLTKGKTSIAVFLRSTGVYNAYGTVHQYETYQKVLTQPTRGVYQFYSHTNPVFEITNEAGQGSVRSYEEAPVKPVYITDNDRMREFKKKVNNHIESIVAGTNLILTDPNNYYNSIEYIALSYFIPWTVYFGKQEVVNKVIAATDANMHDYFSNNAQVSRCWGGCYGRIGYAVALLKDQIGTLFDTSITINGVTKTRRAFWSEMFLASREFARQNQKYITNQQLENVQSLFGANMALQVLGSTQAFSTEQAMRYIQEAIGDKAFSGNDLPGGGTDWNKRQDFYWFTQKGTSHEPGWVSQDCYGYLGPKLMDLYHMTQSPRVLERAVRHEITQSYFNHPTVDDQGFKAIRTEGVICWRNAYHPGKIVYGSPWVAAASMNDTLLGNMKKMIDDNQFFSRFDGVWGIKESRMLFVPESFEQLKAASTSRDHITDPTADDYVMADEENGVLSIKNGREWLFISFFYRAYTINHLAKAHLINDQCERVIEFRPETVLYTKSGKTAVRSAAVQQSGSGTPPDAPVSAYAGLIEDIPLLPDGTTHTDRCLADFYHSRIGEYVVAMNTTPDKTKYFAFPEDVLDVRNVATGERFTVDQDEYEVPPRTTRVYYIEKKVTSLEHANMNHSGFITNNVIEDEIDIQVDSDESNVFIAIFNASGTCVLERSLVVGQNRISLAHLKKEVYILVKSSNKGIQTSKLLKQ